jgi:hypothetical protein
MHGELREFPHRVLGCRLHVDFSGVSTEDGGNIAGLRWKGIRHVPEAFHQSQLSSSIGTHAL